MDGGRPTPRQGEAGPHGPVDPGRGQLGPGGDHGGLPPGQQAQQAHRVAAHVHQGAAGEVEAVADVPALGIGAEKAISMWRTGPSSPEWTISDQARRQRVVAVVEGLGHHQARGGGGAGHRAGLGGVGGEGLLAEHVLAGGQGGQRSSVRGGRWAAGCRRRRPRGPSRAPRRSPRPGGSCAWRRTGRPARGPGRPGPPPRRRAPGGPARSGPPGRCGPRRGRRTRIRARPLRSVPAGRLRRRRAGLRTIWSPKPSPSARLRSIGRGHCSSAPPVAEVVE